MLAELLESRQQRLIARPGRTRIEKERFGGEDSLSVKIMLGLLARLVADAYRSHAPIAGQALGDVLFGDWPPIDRVNRNEMRVVATRGHVEEESEVALDRARLPQSAERVGGKIRIARPAVAVIPGAAGVGSFGDRGRNRGDNGPRCLIDIQLQRNRSADYGVTPFGGSL